MDITFPDLSGAGAPQSLQAQELAGSTPGSVPLSLPRQDDVLASLHRQTIASLAFLLCQPPARFPFPISFWGSLVPLENPHTPTPGTTGHLSPSSEPGGTNSSAGPPQRGRGCSGYAPMAMATPQLPTGLAGAGRGLRAITACRQGEEGSTAALLPAQHAHPSAQCRS